MMTQAINGSATTQAADMAQRFRQQQHEYRYLLVDPLKVLLKENPLSLPALQARFGEDAIVPVLRRDLAWSPQHCPHLILLASPDEQCHTPLLAQSETLARSEALEEKRYLCSWLSSPSPPCQLAEQLENQWGQLTTRYTPFFEPLRFELLQAMAPDNGLAGTIWPVSHWWYMTSTGEISGVKGREMADTGWMTWGIQQVQRDIKEIGRLLLAWQTVHSPLPVQAARQAAERWLQARDSGLTLPDDLRFLALNHLTLPTDITLHPAIRALIQQAMAASAVSFEQRLTGLPQNVWDELARQISAQQEVN